MNYLIILIKFKVSRFLCRSVYGCTLKDTEFKKLFDEFLHFFSKINTVFYEFCALFYHNPVYCK
jgi:hypothetical protein